MENKNYALWGGVTLGVIVIVLGLMWLVGSTPTPQPGTNIVMPPVTEGDWQTGPVDAKLTLVEYSDFQCPACGLAYPVIKRIKAEYASTTRIVYRHFPLPQHLDAKVAAYAAEAAGRQGKFFEMHDLLFEKQSEWSKDNRILPTDPTELLAPARAQLEEKMISYANALGLDIERFKTDLHSKDITEKVETATEDAKRIGIPATPTFFLNGKQLQLTSPSLYPELRDLIDNALKNS